MVTTGTQLGNINEKLKSVSALSQDDINTSC